MAHRRGGGKPALPVQQLKRQLQGSASGDGGDKSRFTIVCDACSNSCAMSAKFCGSCGGKVTRIVRAALSEIYALAIPTEVLIPARDGTLPSALLNGNQGYNKPIKSRKTLNSPPVPSKPARIEKLTTTSASLLQPQDARKETTKRTQAPPQHQREDLLIEDNNDSSAQPCTQEKRILAVPQRESAPTRDPERADQQNQAIKEWAARTRYFLETLLELRRSVDRRELEEKCLQTLTKITELELEVSQKIQELISDNQIANSRTSSIKPTPEFPDAEMVIRGHDGKKMFFKKRFRGCDGGILSTDSNSSRELEAAAPRSSALVVPHLPRSPEKDCEVSVLKQKRISQAISRRQWPGCLLLRIACIGFQIVVVRVDEDDENDSLVISVYSPLTSHESKIAIQFGSLEFILPAPLAWYRTSEVQRCKQVEEHWSRCLPKILDCLRWKATAELEVCFPIQFRQGKLFSFRTYESFPGLLSVRLCADFSLKIEFIDVTKLDSLVLHIPERNILMLVSDYRLRLQDKPSRDGLFYSICQKLYFEYTSRGFELVFPGIPPKGRPRRHPSEVSMLDEYNKRMDDERKRFAAVMSACIRQVTTLARRRLEQYHARQQAIRKQRQEHAASSIQSQIRHTIARKKRREECKLQRIAAILIQRQFRKRREREVARRARKRQLHDRFGLLFKYACRINQTFLLLNVSVNEIDSGMNWLELELRGWHPSSSNGGPAVLRVTYEELNRIMSMKRDATNSSTNSAFEDQMKVTRRAIVDLVVSEHLDVFRSVKHNLLVLSTKNVAMLS